MTTIDSSPVSADHPQQTEPFITLREASARGWGSYSTLLKVVQSGEVPHERSDGRGTYLVLESDLRRHPTLARIHSRHHFSARRQPQSEPGRCADAAGLSDLAGIMAAVVATWPAFTDERKSELRRLLAA